MWIKVAIALVLVSAATAGILSYNKAIAKAAELEQQNTELRQGIKEAVESAQKADAERQRVENLLANQQIETEIIYEKQIETVEVVREIEVKTEADACLDIALPRAVVELFNTAKADNNSEGGETIPAGGTNETLSSPGI
jgi:hypothetical protein